jgi:hypothetical protein
MTNRNRSTGRYVDTRLDKRCVCEHSLGKHSAERVGDQQECLHPGCRCESFREKRTVRDPQEIAREITAGLVTHPETRLLLEERIVAALIHERNSAAKTLGSRTSARKTAAARRNALLGGRPRKRKL